MSNLYLIATPIGNRLDITVRALKTLFSVEILLCEDTHKTKQLLDFYLQSFPDLLTDKTIPQLISFFEHNEEQKLNLVLNFLKQDKNVGLVSNAGTPTISDPGFRLVKICRENKFNVITIPGPSAVIAALSISGLSSDKFLFLGFLPRKTGKQTKIWEEIKNSKLDQTVIFYESPFRIGKTLEHIKVVFGNIEITVARELTKIHEELVTAPISFWEERLQRPLKGELVVLFRSEK
ncbi:16S rRNA (cytidine(1402)-2'-O)-methyltransferase [Candidatus Beckwithbacteria bacterium]|nr:16S rRNA (cytidine(1402)-2'-O)-methyltransferase [Candidatus Beckwithbacteria bacterium]